VSSALPKGVARFIDKRITSVTDLEVLLAMARAAGTVSTRTLADDLRVAPGHIVQAVASLRAADLVAPGAGDGTWAYAAPDDAADDCVNWLLANYRTYRVAITTRIFSRPKDKITGLGEGFLLRRPRDDDDG
jgi:hypothetical protein